MSGGINLNKTTNDEPPPYEEAGPASMNKSDPPPPFSDDRSPQQTPVSVQPVMATNQAKGISYLLIALVLFLIGLCTFILWICLWPVAFVFLILGLIELFKTPEETVQTV
mmetsp:Transcript_15/g.19  ORF Transcript_15/g.19 Transcript_15/m.19 type:complete len:110 (-) Transcript_15:232-561(-)